MKVHADIEVAVLSARTDLDLAISTWLPGYVAQRTDDPEVVMDVTRRGGVVLIDLGSPRHEEWVAALRDRGFDGPTVFLGPRGDVAIDLRDRVVVPSPPSLAGLLAGFEEAQLTMRGPRRRRGSDGGARTAPWGHRRAAAAVTPAHIDRPGAAEGSGPAGPRAEVAAGPGTEVAAGPGTEVAGRARRLDRHQDPEAAAVPPARRSGGRQAARASTLWGSLRRRSPAVVSLPAGEMSPQGDRGPARLDDEAERAFQAAFREADIQPGVQRRIATPDGRIRVQTDEELFDGQPASTPAEGERGTVLTPVPPRERRPEAGA